MLPHDVGYVLEAFGEAVRIGSRTVSVVWGDPFSEVPTGDTSIASRDTGFLVSAAVAETIAVGDPVVRNGLSYRVSHQEPEFDGAVIRIVLEREQ
jgi:hypothetical protein